ncbi:MAG: hypothetical protein NWF10_08145 [Candidatus Bathyarchaeota archaeon]|nr:hypothetical protein [Candidatus Bathyarchaeota archaeon]
MDLFKIGFMKKALLIVSIVFLLYTLYHGFVTLFFLYNFIPNIAQLPEFFSSSSFPWQLLLMQEFASSVGIYLRLFGGVLAVSSAYLFNKNDLRYLGRFNWVLLFESLYFVLFIPSGINHVIGSFSEFTFDVGFNPYTGVSFLLQGLLIFPSLFLLSRKLKENKDPVNLFRWVGIAASLYVFGIWIKHGFFWFFALSSLGLQSGTWIESFGAVNSLITLLLASLVTLYACLPLIRKTKNVNLRWVGTALILVGAHFAIYLIVSFWVPVYLSFLGLTEFWMVALLIPGLVALLKMK